MEKGEGDEREDDQDASMEDQDPSRGDSNDHEDKNDEQMRQEEESPDTVHGGVGGSGEETQDDCMAEQNKRPGEFQSKSVAFEDEEERPDKKARVDLARVDVAEIYSPVRVTEECSKFGLKPGDAM